MRDHLGNARVSFSDISTPAGIEYDDRLQTNTYYPYGSTIAPLSSSTPSLIVPNDYKFNDIELIDDLGLNLHLADFRAYDALIGRWAGVDPKPYPSISTYSGMACNPARYADPRGDTIVINLGDRYHDPLWSQKVVKRQKNDGIYLVLSHASPRALADHRTGEIPLYTGEEIHNSLIAADKALNFKKNGKYRYGKKSYEESVTSGNNIQVILYACNTACHVNRKGERVDLENVGGKPVAQRFSEYLSTFNTENLVTGANGEIIGAKFFIRTPYNDNADQQTGAWVTYQGGSVKYFRKLEFFLESGQKYILPNNENFKLKLGTPQEMKNDDYKKYIIK